MDMSWGPGREIAGRYRLVSQLGQGGMGSVWRADHMSLSSPVAIKLIDPEIARRPEMLERFQREAQSSAALRSPHVVQILDYGVDEGVPFIAMELLEGESLAARLARLHRLPFADTVRVVSHIGRALAKAHEGNVIHRDLKPDNVFLVKNDDKEIAKVLDFGIAKITGNGPGSAKGNATRTGSILGTPSYMSPEQAQGTKTIDGRSDLWSLAVIAFECVVGHVPFQSEALGDLLIKICVHPIPVPSQLAMVPPGFDAWWARASNRDPNLRFQSGKELADALRQVLVPEAGLALSSGPMSPAVAAMSTSHTVGAEPMHVSAFTPTPPPQYTPTPPHYASAPPQYTPVPASGPTMHSASGQPPGPQFSTAAGAAVNVVQPAASSKAPLFAAGAVLALVFGGLGTWLAIGRGGASNGHANPSTVQSATAPATQLTAMVTPPDPRVAPAPPVTATATAATRPGVPVKTRPTASVPATPVPPPTPPPPTPPPPPVKPPDRVGF